MQVITHYPHVLLATNNVATDHARADNQVKPPILPPEQANKTHEERAFNPKNERAPAYTLVEKDPQQAAKQAQSELQKLLDPKTLLPQPLKIATNNTPVLKRKDIQNKVANSDSTVRQNQMSKNTKPSINAFLVDQEPAYFQQRGEQISQYYQQQTTPNEESQLFALI